MVIIGNVGTEIQSPHDGNCGLIVLQYAAGGNTGKEKSLLMPDSARALAARLIELADKAEAMPVTPRKEHEEAILDEKLALLG